MIQFSTSNDTIFYSLNNPLPRLIVYRYIYKIFINNFITISIHPGIIYRDEILYKGREFDSHKWSLFLRVLSFSIQRNCVDQIFQGIIIILFHGARKYIHRNFSGAESPVDEPCTNTLLRTFFFSVDAHREKFLENRISNLIAPTIHTFLNFCVN